MTRVRGVVDKSIMVEVRDVVAGDVLHVSSLESDPIIVRVEHKNGLVRFHYREERVCNVTCSVWMPESDDCFIHDFKNERDDFEWEEFCNA